MKAALAHIPVVDGDVEANMRLAEQGARETAHNKLTYSIYPRLLTEASFVNKSAAPLPNVAAVWLLGKDLSSRY